MLTILDDYLKRKYPDASRKEVMESLDKQADDIGQKCAERLTRGNVSIQNGDFRSEAGAPGAMHPRLKRLLHRDK